jgi:hypothetical protein
MSSVPAMPDVQWFLTEGNGSLTVRIREGLRVGEQSSGLLALDDPKRISQWFRFYFSEQGELWIACLHGFAIHTEKNSELRRYRFAVDTKIELPNNEFYICRDPFQVKENFTPVIIRPVFSTYVSSTNAPPVLKTPRLSIQELQTANIGQGKSADVRNNPDDTLANTIPGGSDRLMAESVSSTGQTATAILANDKARGIAEYPPAEEWTSRQDSFSSGSNFTEPESEPEPDYYISSLWEERSANPKATSTPLVNQRNEKPEARVAVWHKLRRSPLAYLSAGMVTGCSISLLLFTLFNSDNKEAASVSNGVPKDIISESLPVTAAIEHSAFNTIDQEARENTGFAGESDKSHLLSTQVNEIVTGNTLTHLDGSLMRDTEIAKDQLVTDDEHSAELFSAIAKELSAKAKKITVTGKFSDNEDHFGSENMLAGENIAEGQEILVREKSLGGITGDGNASSEVIGEKNATAEIGKSGEKTSAPTEEDWRLTKARLSLQRGEVVTPPGRNAVAYLQSYLVDNPQSEEALVLINQCANQLTTIAEGLYQKGESFDARNTLEEVLAFEPDNERANSLWIAWHGKR